MEKELNVIANCFDKKLQGQGWGESMLEDCLIVEKSDKTKYVAFEDITYALQYGLRIEESDARALRAELVQQLLDGSLRVPGFVLKEIGSITFVKQT